MRALLLVLDTAGCGDALEGAAARARGANTLEYLLQDRPSLSLPTLHALGLWKAVTGDVFHPLAQGVRACWGRMREQSRGKETTTGHWEMAGVLLQEPFPTFREFPADFVQLIERDAKVTFLGNRRANGQALLEELGPEHLRTGRPILYTSDDSVLQIAAHEEVISQARLHEICRRARRQADKLRIGRVIARPFVGQPGSFVRTAGRREYAMMPPRTILNALAEAGLLVSGVGKIGDVFAGSGLTRSHLTRSNGEALALIEELWRADEDGLIFANLSDFEGLYNHRRDAAAYGKALEMVDDWLSYLLPQVESDDLVIITADHGLTASRTGADEREEEVPLLMLHQDRVGPLGTRRSYTDIAATLGQFFGLRQPWPTGRSFLHSRATRVQRPVASAR